MVYYPIKVVAVASKNMQETVQSQETLQHLTRITLLDGLTMIHITVIIRIMTI